ncbi:MAG: FAD-dependent oxidoreductase, partial [Mucilaginibacter sp.]
MIKKLLLPLLFFAFSFADAETIKTDVLVIGGGSAGVAAAIQSARSKVKTLLVEPGPWLGGSMTMGGMCVLDGNRNLPSGIWGEFRKKITDYYKNRLGYDTTRNSILRFEPYTAADILKKWTDTLKNLTVKLKTPWTNIKKDGTGWEVTIMVNGQAVTVVAKVVVDGTETGDVAAKAKALFVEEGAGERKETMTEVAILKDFGRNADKTIAKPEGYDPGAYAYLKGKDIAKMQKDGAIPNDKYMINWMEFSRTIDAVKFTASAERFSLLKDELYKESRRQTLGLVYYLQTELGYKNLGIDDQFNTADHLPFVPYMKEGMKVTGAVRMVLDDILKPYDRESKLYRTSIAVGDGGPGPQPDGQNTIQYPPYTIPLGSIVPKDIDNLLVTEKALSVTSDVNASTMDPAVQMTLGQGVGATAAYCAFFKTTTKHLTVRIIQGEILDYKGYLLPFTDILQKDPHWRAIQQVAATGLLRGIQKANGKTLEVHFGPDDVVSTEEIKPVLTEIYTRAFLWFNTEKPGDKFT